MNIMIQSNTVFLRVYEKQSVPICHVCSKAEGKFLMWNDFFNSNIQEKPFKAAKTIKVEGEERLS